jgi:hypothetical protein
VPVRKRIDRRAATADFRVTPELRAAFDAYISSDPADHDWREHWALHDLLDEAGALPLPLITPCCWHPRLTGVNWAVLPGAVAAWRRLSAGAKHTSVRRSVGKK